MVSSPDSVGGDCWGYNDPIHKKEVKGLAIPWIYIIVRHCLGSFYMI